VLHGVAKSTPPLFAGLPIDDVQALANIARLEHFEAGQALFWEGDEPPGLRIVYTGAVKIFKLASSTGREMILTIERPGHAVAELPTLDGGPYPANAAALQPTQTLLLPRDALESLMLERPSITRHLLRSVGTRLRHLVGLIEALSFQQVVGRLSAHLLERADDGLPFTLETNAMIAARIGTVNELVTRNLSRLAGNELIRLEGRTVTAINRAGLEAYTEGEQTSVVALRKPHLAS
jgi:CRP/FNR family transcriptional regulator